MPKWDIPFYQLTLSHLELPEILIKYKHNKSIYFWIFHKISKIVSIQVLIQVNSSCNTQFII